jgi:DNA replication protein DnaC
MRGAAERYERLLVASRMTKRFRERTFANFVPRHGTELALAACCRFVEQSPNTQGVMLIGPPGTGKTHLMAACANALLDRGVRVIFACVPDVLADLRRAVGADALEDVVAELRECEVLCLDDLGAERVTDWAREQVYRLINYRYEAELPVLATSNLDADALAEQLGDRIVSRLAEMCVWVRMECDDYRLRKEVPA